MTSSFLEIVQLADGEIVLKRSEEEGEPLVEIRFSEESKAYLGDSDIDIAKVMIQAGIQAAAYFSESQLSDSEMSKTLDDSEEHTLH